MTSSLPREILPFLAGNETHERSLLALAAAESLTNDLAYDLVRVGNGGNGDPTRLVDALHLCDFVVERNSEWHLSPRVREKLIERLTKEEAELSRRLHHRLLALTESRVAEEDPRELPRYLQTGVGRAYHESFLSAEGVRGYSRVADQPLSGQQWLAGYLASEQVRLGVISEDAVEVTYLRGMILYREGRKRDAEPLLRRVADGSEPRREVAVAAHLVGRIDGKRFKQRKRGESLLWKSLDIGRALDESPHIAQVLNTLGQLIGRDRERRAEAEELLRESLEIERSLDNPSGAAQALHTLGQLIGRDRDRRAEAEELLRESLEIEWSLDNPSGAGQALHTLGQMIGRDRDRRAEAEELLRESLEIGRALGESFHIAQVLNTLGQLIGRDHERRAEAEEMLRESLQIGRDRNRLNHQAQVLYGLSQLEGMPPAAAEELLRESLEINRQTHDTRGEKIVQRALRRLREER